MKKYIFAKADLFENVLVITIEEAYDWRDIVRDSIKDIDSMTLEEAKEAAFNQDWLFDIKEL